MPGSQRLIDSNGVARDVPNEQVGEALAAGFRAPTAEDSARDTAQAAQEADYGGVGGAAKAGAYGVARGLTLGASDVLANAAGVPVDRLHGLEQQNPVTSGVAELGGAVLPAIASGGTGIGARILAKSPAAAVSAVGHGLAENIGAKTVLGKVATGALTGAVEGGLFGGGEYLSQVALKDKPLSAEGFVGGVGHAALFGAALGGGTTLVGETLQRAKSLFPRSTITPEAGKVAASEAKSALQQSVADGDQMVELAKQKIDLAAAHDGMAAAGEGVTRTAFGASDPQIAALRGAAAAEHGQLVNAIKAYERSKVELNNWLNSEAGLDLESSLTDLRVPDVQKGVRKGPYIERLEPIDRKADRLYNADLEVSMRGVKAPDVSPEGARLAPPADESLDSLLSRLDTPDVQRTPVPSGEFGAPGRGGIKTPQELEEAVAKASGADAPATKVLGGGPRRAFAQPDAGAPVADILTGVGRPRAPSDIAADITNAGRKSLPKAEEALADVTNVGRKRPIAAADIASAPEPIVSPPAAPTGPIEVKRISASNGTFEASFPDGSKVPLVRDEIDAWIEKQLPDGFKPGRAIESFRDFSIERDLPRVSGDVKENAVYIARPSDLADHGIFGNELRAEASEYHASARKSGARQTPVQIDVTPDGRWYVDDGNHRLHEAAKTNSEVAIRFRPKNPDKGWTPPKSARDISERLRNASGRVATQHAELAASTRAAPTSLGKGEFTAVSKNLLGNMSPEAHAALNRYSRAGGFGPINGDLRRGADRFGDGSLKMLDDYLLPQVRSLDEAIASSPAPRDMVVYRGINGGPHDGKVDLSTLKVGDFFVDHGFVSTSADPEIGSEFSKGFNQGDGVELVITVPVGQPAAPVPSEFGREREFLLPRGSRFRVDRVETNDSGGRVIHVTSQNEVVGIGSPIEAPTDSPVAVSDSAQDRLRAASTPAEPARPSPAAMSEDYDPFDVLPPPRKAKPLPQAVRAPDGPSPMADAEFADYKQRYMGATTAEHFNAGMHYSGSAYQAINETLRAGKTLTGDAARMQAALDDALSRPEAKLAREVTLYRGLSGPDAKARFAKLKPGEVIEDPAYMSTASNPDSRVRNEDIVFHIDAPRGTAAAPIPSQYDSERELLLGRGTKLRILSNELVPQVPTPYRWQGAVGHEVHPDNSVTIDFGGKHGTMKVPPMREIRATIVSDAVKADVTGAEVGKLMKGVNEATGVGRNPLNDIPTYEHLKSLDSDPITTVPSSTIRDRGWYEVPGQGEDVVKADKARKAIAEGQRDPIQLVVSPSGKLQVNDGRNRLMAAVEADKPIKVRWSYGSDPGPGDVHKFGASDNVPAAASADDNSLEALLRGTKSKLDAGENIKDIGAPVREKYAADKADIRAAQAEHFRGLANEKNFAGSDMGAAEREAQAATADAEPSRYLQAALDRKAGRSVRAAQPAPPPKSELGSLLDKIKDMSVEGGGAKAAISDDAYKAMLAEKFGVPEGYEIRDIVDGAPELRVKGSGPTVVDKDLLPAMGRAADDAAIERALRKHNGKNKDIGADFATAAKVIGDHETASADLADLLGEQAPPGARARAAALRDATRAQADNAGAQAASVADQLSDKTVVNRDLKSAMQRIVDDAKIDKLTATNPEANAAPNITPPVAAAESAPASAASGSTGVGKSALNLGTALEVMHAMGIGVPSLSSIPVIGPVLSLFFKARAILGVLGRKGGSIGRTAESSIAGKAAETRERILVATRLMLDGGSKVAKAGAKVAPPLAGILATKLFPGDDVKSKDPQVLFKARMDELARAQQPNAVRDAITDRIHASDPELVQAIIQQTQKGLDFLASKAPKQTMLPGMLPGDGVWHPSKAALETWARYVKAVNDPASVIEDLSRGVVTMEGAETLRTVYPALYQEAQRTLLELAPKYQQTMPYPRRIAISVMYQVPIDGSMTAAHMQFLHPPVGPAGPQGGGAPAAPPPPSAGPAITGPLQIGTQTSTALDRRAGM